MFEDLKPEYLHILLNPYVTHGMPLAELLLCGGLVTRKRPLIVGALLLLVLTAGLAYPTVEIGEEAYDRMGAVVSDVGQAWLDEHLRRAQLVAPVLYGVVVLALTAVIAPLKYPKSAMPLALATLVVGGGACAAAGYVAYAGGRVSHQELRGHEAPPEAPKPVSAPPVAARAE